MATCHRFRACAYAICHGVFPTPPRLLNTSEIHIAIAEGFARDIVPAHTAGRHVPRLAEGLVQDGLVHGSVQITHVEGGKL